MARSELNLIPVLHGSERCRIWRRSIRRRYDPAPRRLPELNVLLCTKGRARYFINGRIIQFRPRLVLFAQPGDSHFLVRESADADFVVALVDPAMISAPPAHPEVAPSDGQVDRQVHALSESAFREVVDLSRTLSDAPNAKVLEMGMSWWLHRLWQHCQAASPVRHDDVHPSVALALTRLHDAPQISIADVARDLPISSDHLSVLFRKHIGTSMIQYRTALRLEAVARLVQGDPGCSLETAALEAGFRDYSSFYRAFRKHRGQSPRAGLLRDRDLLAQLPQATL